MPKNKESQIRLIKQLVTGQRNSNEEVEEEEKDWSDEDAFEQSVNSEDNYQMILESPTIMKAM